MAKSLPKNEYYLGNPNIPNKNWKGEWDEKKVKYLEKSKDNLLYFAENFFYIVDPDKGKVCIELFPYQKRILRTLRDNRRVILLASRQCGKALDVNTPIKTPTGWRNMGELKDGDQVYGLNGSPCNIVKAHDVMYDRICYEVEFDNGEKIVADAEHNWFTQTRAERIKGLSGSVRTTEDILHSLNTSQGEPNHRIPTCVQGLQGPDIDLTVDPYLIGLWLGDGCKDSSTITIGKRDIEFMLSKLEGYTQYKVIVKKWKGQSAYSVRLGMLSGLKGMKKEDCLNSQLRKYNLLNNKHIPTEFMYASREQRLKLLQGLMDSDGYVNSKGYAQFYNTNIDLAMQVKELIESLGYKTTCKILQPTLYGRECAQCLSVSFTPREMVCTIPFKAKRIRVCSDKIDTRRRNQWNYIKRIVPVESRPVRCITVDSEDSLYLCGKSLITTHNTTCLTIYALWLACFFDYQNIVIVANKESTAMEIFRRVRLAYEEIPNYLKPGVREYAKTSCEFDNGSRISISTTTGSAARGQSINCLLIDECAFIEPESILEDFWRSVFPTLSRSKKSKVLIASTPNGTGNLFHKLYEGSEKGENGFVSEKVPWYDIPGRDEKWKQEQLAALGSVESFLQEYEVQFLSVGDSAINDALFYELSQKCVDPLVVLDDGNYKIYENPDSTRIYVAGVDISEGVGIDASVIQIFDITDPRHIKQVAVYHNRQIPPLEFTNKLHTILKNWGSPLALIERNNCGAQVVDRLAFDIGYEKVVSYGAKIAGRNRPQMGMIAHTNTKQKGVSNMRHFVNDMKVVEFRDIETLKEIKEFVRYPNGTWKAKGGFHDDRVMAAMYALFILDKEITERYLEILEVDDYGKPCSVAPMDFGVSLFENPTSIYTDFEVVGDNNTFMTPIVFGMGGSDVPAEMSMLEQEGWSILG